MFMVLAISVSSESTPSRSGGAARAEIGAHVRLAVFVRSAENSDADVATGSSGHPAGHGLHHRSEQGVDNPLHGMGARIHWRGRARIDDAALRQLQTNRAEAAAIGRTGGI